MNVKNNVKSITILTVLVLLLTSCGKRNDRNGRPRGTPTEAIEACEGKAAGDSVRFTGRRGETMDAICQEVEGQLVAVPEKMRR